MAVCSTCGSLRGRPRSLLFDLGGRPLRLLSVFKRLTSEAPFWASWSLISGPPRVWSHSLLLVHNGSRSWYLKYFKYQQRPWDQTPGVQKRNLRDQPLEDKKEPQRSTSKVKKEARRSISWSQKGAWEVDLLKKGKEPKRSTSRVKKEAARSTS